MCRVERPVLVIAAAAAGLVMSCTRLPAPALGNDTLATEVLPEGGRVPSSWGRLVAVTQDPAGVNLHRLWFSDSVGVTRVVLFAGARQQLGRSVLVIPRN